MSKDEDMPESIDLGQTLPSLPRQAKKKRKQPPKSAYELNSQIELDESRPNVVAKMYSQHARQSSEEPRSPADESKSAEPSDTVDQSTKLAKKLSQKEKNERQIAARQNYLTEVPVYRCSSCNTELSADTVICTACGFNLLSGEHMKPTVAVEEKFGIRLKKWLKGLREGQDG